MIHCSVRGNTGIGINCFNDRHTVIGCTVLNNSGGGINADKTLIRDCTVDANTGFGVRILTGCMIEGDNIGATQGSGIAGLNITGSGNSAPTSSDPATAGPWHNIVL